MARLLFVFAALGMCGCLSLASGGASLAATRTCSPDQAAALPEGARVELMEIRDERGLVTDETHVTKRVGTVLKASPDGVALINCVVEFRNSRGNNAAERIPYLGRLVRNTGVGMEAVPVVWVPLAEMGNVRIVEPPPADHVPLTLEIDTAPPRPLYEAIGVDFDFNTAAVSVSPQTRMVVEQVDGPTGRVYRRFAIPAEGEATEQAVGTQSLD